MVNLVGNFDLRDGKGKASIPLRHYEAYRPQIKRRKETSKGENEKEVEEYFWSCRQLENTSQILLGLISAILKENFYRYLSRIMSIQRKQRHEDEGSMSNVPHIPSDNQGS